MICSGLPVGALLPAEAVSRISFSLSLDDSPAAQRLLQRAMDAGIGLFARHVPLANWKKSLHGSALRSRSPTSMPCREVDCDTAKGEHESKKTSSARTEHRGACMNSLQVVAEFRDSHCRSGMGCASPCDGYWRTWRARS